MSIRALFGALLVAAILTALCFTQFSKLEPEWDLEGFFAEGTSDRVAYEQMRELFGRDDRTGLVLASRARALDGADFRALAESTARLTGLDGVAEVRSPTNLQIVVRDERDQVVLEDALPTDFTAERLQLAVVRMQQPPYVRVVLSEDGHSAMLTASLAKDRVDVPDRAKLRDDLDAEAERLRELGFDVRIGGYPVQRAMLTEVIGSEAGRLFPWIIVVLALSLAVTMRSMMGVVAPLVVVTIASLWTTGLMGALNLQPNLFATAVYTLVLVIGVSDSVHVLARYQELAPDLGVWEAVSRTVRELVGPCLLTSATTAMGFAALTLSPIPSISVFGRQVAVGVLAAWVVTFLVVPPLLVGWGRVAGVPRRALGGRLTTWLGRLDARIAAHPRRALLLVACVCAVAVVGLGFLDVNSPLLADLDQDHPIIETNARLERDMAGVLGLEVVLSPQGKASETYATERMRSVDSLTKRLRALPGIITATSLVDPLHHFARQLNADKDAWDVVPAALLLAAEELDPWVHEETGTQRIRMTMRNLDTDQSLALFADIERIVAEELGVDGGGSLTGAAYVGQLVNARIMEHLQMGFLAALAAVFLTLVIGLRDVRLAALSLFPNLLPVLIVSGVMGFAGIDLRYTSALVLTVVFGIAVDDTIHFLAAVDNTAADPVREAFERAGPGILLTSVALSAGFSVLLLSTFVPNRVLGGLLMVTAATALLGDLVLLPALLRVWKR
jgi:uncharacterized protein